MQTHGQKIKLHREQAMTLSVLLTHIVYPCLDFYMSKSVKYSCEVFEIGCSCSTHCFASTAVATGSILHSCFGQQLWWDGWGLTPAHR